MTARDVVLFAVIAPVHYGSYRLAGGSLLPWQSAVVLYPMVGAAVLLWRWVRGQSVTLRSLDR